MFLTPFRRGVPEREEVWMEGAECMRIQVDEERDMPIYTWGKGESVVLLVHGWSGRGSQLGAYVEPLLERGFRVVSFDAPGHGKAGGGLTGLPEFAKVIVRVAQEVGPVHSIVAHSMGAAATTIALSLGLSLQRLVYISPPDAPGKYLKRVAQYLGFREQIVGLAQARIEARFGFMFEDILNSRLAREMELPLLVIHDRDDAEVPYEEGKRIAQSWQGAGLMTTHGLGHHRILREPRVVEETIQFVELEGASASAVVPKEVRVVAPQIADAGAQWIQAKA